MSVFDERPGSMRGHRSGDQGQFQARMEPAPAPASAKTRTGRRLGGVDNGTVALAVSGMSIYWMMPMLMSRRKHRLEHPPADSGSARE